jgi:hypothetical protein
MSTIGQMCMLGLVAVFLVGCPAPESTPKKAVAMPAIVLPKTVEAPADLRSTSDSLALITESDPLFVGDSFEQVDKLFPSPAGSVPVKELPAAFGTEYEGRGYDAGSKSFGAIFYADKLALAMTYRSALKVAESSAITKSYHDRFGPPDISVGKGFISYSFWEKESQRLMMCVSTDEKTQLRNLTISVGHKNLMDALRMSDRHATNDVRNAESLPDEKRSGE